MVLVRLPPVPRPSRSNATAAENRAALEDLAERPWAPGLVRPSHTAAPSAGLSLGPRQDYDRLSSRKILARFDDTPVWFIVCFVVSRKIRGQGIACAMLAVAIAFARAHGATTLEAYPIEASGGRVPVVNAFHGTLAMFERAGFSRSSSGGSGILHRRSGRSSGCSSSLRGRSVRRPADIRFKPSTSSVAAGSAV